MTTSIAAAQAANNRETAGSVSLPHEARIRRTIGAAHARIAASGEKVKAALKVHHSTVSHRKAGLSPFASAAIEADRMERAGICTDPLTDALRRIVLIARGWVGCIKTRMVACVSADAREDVARTEYNAGLPGSRERWADALLAQARESEEMARALLAGEGPR